MICGGNLTESLTTGHPIDSFHSHTSLSNSKTVCDVFILHKRSANLFNKLSKLDFTFKIMQGAHADILVARIITKKLQV